MNDLGWALVLQVVSLALLFGEIFLPSGGLLILATAAALGLSLWCGFEHGSVAGWMLVGADLVVFPLCLRWGFDRLASSPWVLQSRLAGKAPSGEDAPVGLQRGTVVAALRPVGKVRVGAEVFDARSTSTFLEPGDSVEVCGRELGQILVRPVRVSPD